MFQSHLVSGCVSWLTFKSLPPSSFSFPSLTCLAKSVGVSFLSLLDLLPYYCCLLNQSVPLLLSLLGVVGNEHSSGAKSVTLFCIDSCLALLCASSRLGIGHTEDVVSLNASVEPAVAWDGSAKLLSLSWGVVNTVEDLECIFVGLLISGSLLGVSKIYGLGLGCLLLNALWGFNSVEFINCGRRDGLYDR